MEFVADESLDGWHGVWFEWWQELQAAMQKAAMAEKLAEAKQAEVGALVYMNDMGRHLAVVLLLAVIVR
jgi:hypothetical protein